MGLFMDQSLSDAVEAVEATTRGLYFSLWEADFVGCHRVT